jgi:Zn-dependent protease
MTLQTAATHLLALMNLPPGAVNVLPISTSDGGRLVVWIDSRYILRARNVPSSYEGYAVSIEPRPEITVH